MFGIILLTQGSDEFRVSLAASANAKGLWKCQQMLAHSFLRKGPRFLWTHLRRSCDHGLWMRGKPGNFCRENPGMCRGKEAAKEPQAQRFCPSGRAGKCSVEHRAGRRGAHSSSICQGLRKDAANLLSESLGRGFSSLNGYKKPFGTTCERESSRLTQPKYTELGKEIPWQKTSSGLFVLSGLNKRKDDGVVLSNQRRECFRGKV